MNKEYRGSFTIEASVIVSMLCWIIGCVIMFGFYGHDLAVLQSSANVISMKACLYKNRCIVPDNGTIDTETLLDGVNVDLISFAAKEQRAVEDRLLCGKIQDLKIKHSIFKERFYTEISAEFQIFSWHIPCKVNGQSISFLSRQLPRKINEELETD